MELYILRHGTALSMIQDPQEGLSHEGTEEVKKMAHFLKKEAKTFDSILCSTKKRAQQTATLVADGLTYDRSKILQTEKLKSLSSTNDTLEFIENHAHGKKILIVSHLPLVSHLVSYLLLGNEELSLPFSPASCVKIIKDSFDSLSGRMAWFISPQIL